MREERTQFVASRAADIAIRTKQRGKDQEDYEDEQKIMRACVRACQWRKCLMSYHGQHAVLCLESCVLCRGSRAVGRRSTVKRHVSQSLTLGSEQVATPGPGSNIHASLIGASLSL